MGGPPLRDHHQEAKVVGNKVSSVMMILMKIQIIYNSGEEAKRLLNSGRVPLLQG